MTDTNTAAARDGRGRFQPGASGNPAGKKPGTLNHATRLKVSLEEGDFDTVARQIIERAREGNFVAARFLIDRLDPKPRGRPIELEIPDDARGAERYAVVTRAMCAGEITPDEALVVVRVLEAEDKASERAAAAQKPAKKTPDEERAAWLEYRRHCQERDAVWDAAAERVFGQRAAEALQSTCNSESDALAEPPPSPPPQAGEGSEPSRGEATPPLHSTSISPPPVDPAALLPTPRRRAVNRARAEAARRSGWAG